MRTWLAILLSLGCSSKDTADTSGSHHDAAAPYIADHGETEVPEISTQKMAAAIEESITAVMSLKAQPLFDVYKSATAGGDSDCPTWATNNDTPYWIGGCTSGDGTRFDGVGTFLEIETYTGGAYTYSGEQLYMVGTITTPAGETLDGSGSAVDLYGETTGGAQVQYVEFDGQLSWDGAGTEGTWLDTGLSPDLAMMSHTDPSGWRSILVDGALEGTTKASAVIFHDLFVVSGASFEGCTPEPNGALSVRDLDGQWIDLEFDGPGPEEWPPEDAGCDGCAVAWYRGLEVGKICPDFEGLRDWESPYPWQ